MTNEVKIGIDVDSSDVRKASDDLRGMSAEVAKTVATRSERLL